MPTFINVIGMLLSGLVGGANSIRQLAAPHAQRYLEVLVGLAWRGTFIPLGIAAIGILGGMTESHPRLWSNIIALAGIVGFLFLALLGALATPIGALIGAALPAGQASSRTPAQQVTWGTVFSPDWIVRLIRGAGQWASDQLRDGVTRYFSLVRKVLAWEVCIFFFVAAMPPLRSATLILILGAISIAVSSKYLSEGWARVVRIAVVVLMAWWMLGSIFPALDPFTNIFGTSAEKLTLGEVAASADKGLALDSGNWKKPSFWIGLAVVALLAYLAVRLFRKAVAPAGTTVGSGHQTAAATASTQGSGSGGKGSLLGKAIMVACLALCAGMLAIAGMKVLELHERRKASIDESLESRKTSQVERRAMQTISAMVAQVNGRTAAQTAASTPRATAPVSAPMELWYGLVKPKKYPIILSTNLSERIPRPEGFSTRTEPRGLRYELWANGRLVPQSPNGPTDFPPGTTFVQYRWTNQTPITMVVGVGKEAK